MRFTTILLTTCILSISGFAQISEMNWELDYQIYLKLANDSNYTYDIREAFHVTNSKEEFTSDYIFYPVNPGQEFAGEVPNQNIYNQEYSTLWNALHAKIGGGWIHFINCIAYALETNKLSLTAPLMQRPDTKWKPKPMTESFKRTKDWEYYVPLLQKNAQKEYNIRVKNEELNDINSIPSSYLDLLLNTTQAQYNLYKEEDNKKQIAQIDLVKVILGANYLGEVQITYMSNAILDAVLSYSNNMLPSVIIFDEYEAAAAMSLNANGYKIENIVYRAAANISEEEAILRREEIEQIVNKINLYNNNSFKQRLGNYYKE